MSRTGDRDDVCMGASWGLSPRHTSQRHSTCSAAQRHARTSHTTHTHDSDVRMRNDESDGDQRATARAAGQAAGCRLRVAGFAASFILTAALSPLKKRPLSTALRIVQSALRIAHLPPHGTCMR